MKYKLKILPLAFVAAIFGLTAASGGGGVHNKVVGGEPTTIAENPWQVALLATAGDNTYFCGGSVVGDRWVVTAAHCFGAQKNAKSAKILANENEINMEKPWITAKSVTIHPNYNENSFENDIAIIESEFPLNAQKITPADASLQLKTDDPLEVTGWGATSEGGVQSKQLLLGRVPYVENSVCNRKGSYDGQVLPSMMCAGRAGGQVDSCQGDSGGPLVKRDGTKAILVGVVSHGDGCGRALKYGVYTRITAHRDWIHSIVRD